MTKVNAKAAAPSAAPAEAPAALTMEQMLEGYLKMKAEKEAAEKRAAEAEAKAANAKASNISFTDKGQIMLTFGAGAGSLTARYYAWHWEAILKAEKEIRAAMKDKRAMTEAAFRAAKAK